MLTSNEFRATSFSAVFAAALLFEGCGSSGETGTNSNLCYYYYVTSRSSLPLFEADLFQTADSAGQRLDLYTSLKNSRLKYEKIGSAYRATYTTNVRVWRENYPPTTKEVQRIVWKAAYPTSSESSYDALLQSFSVKPGDYSVEISVTDVVSGDKATRIYKKTIPDISKREVCLSDILLLARYDTVGQGRKITPYILSNAGLLSDTLNFFTVLLSRKASRDSVFFNVYRLETHERLLSNFGSTKFSSGGVSLDPCAMGIDTLPVFSSLMPVAVDSGFSYIFGGVPKPLSGNYLLEVSLKDGDGNRAFSVLTFRIRGRYFPDITDDLPQMVNSLAYIASRGELARMTEVKSDSAVKANLLKFWADYGGYAKMAEYYKRVSQANRLFSTCLDGWRTPMGMFYVICGPPDYVECRGAYAERWMYTLNTANGRLVIDFRLTRDTPNPDDRYYAVENIYSNLDFWSYYLSRWRTPY
ncbi:MAG: GWxTD domain-containing protein [Bacteroidetes bacterium]|nr:GWxTD domain-containing protein [Bacteroidota bacterium]